MFTAGIGENSETVRRLVCADMEVLGINLDEGANARVHNAAAFISTPDSRLAVLVVPTDEERSIALQTEAVVHAANTVRTT